MSKRTGAEKAGFIVGRTAYTVMLLWALQFPWGVHFVIGMLLLDVAELRYKEWKGHE